MPRGGRARCGRGAGGGGRAAARARRRRSTSTRRRSSSSRRSTASAPRRRRRSSPTAREHGGFRSVDDLARSRASGRRSSPRSSRTCSLERAAGAPSAPRRAGALVAGLLLARHPAALPAGRRCVARARRPWLGGSAAGRRVPRSLVGACARRRSSTGPRWRRWSATPSTRRVTSSTRRGRTPFGGWQAPVALRGEPVRADGRALGRRGRERGHGR